MNVHALAVIDKLPFERLGVVDLDDTGGTGKQLGKLRGAITSGSRDNFEALVIRPYRDWLSQAVVLDGVGKLVQLCLIEGTGVGGGLMNLVDGEKLRR